MPLLGGTDFRAAGVFAGSGETIAWGTTLALSLGAGGTAGDAAFATIPGADADVGSAARFGCVIKYDTPTAATTPAKNPKTIFRFIPSYSCRNNVAGHKPSASDLPTESRI